MAQGPHHKSHCVGYQARPKTVLSTGYSKSLEVTPQEPVQGRSHLWNVQGVVNPDQLSQPLTAQQNPQNSGNLISFRSG